MFNVEEDALQVFDKAALVAEIEAYKAARHVDQCRFVVDQINDRKLNDFDFDRMGKQWRKADEELKSAISRAVLAVQNARVLREVYNQLFDLLD